MRICFSFLKEYEFNYIEMIHKVVKRVFETVVGIFKGNENEQIESCCAIILA